MISEERRHAAAMIFSNIDVGRCFLHVLRAAHLLGSMALPVDPYTNCCQVKTVCKRGRC